MNTPLVIKFGGRLLSDIPALTSLLKQCQQALVHRPILIVHGGGEQLDKQLQLLGLATVKTAGQRVTPSEHIPTIAGVLAGDLNSSLCALAQQQGLQAIGLTLFAGGSIVCERDPERGEVGVPSAGNPDFLQLLLAAGYLPVISSLGMASEGKRLNVNADLAAAAIAQLVHGDLVLLTDVPGILDAAGSLIPTIQADHVDALIAEGTVHGGMQVKLSAAISAARASRRSIAVAGWQDAEVLTLLAQGDPIGTRIIL